MTWVLIPNIIFYIQLVAAGRVGLSIPGFIGLIGLSFLNLLFYMTLALMLATLFNNGAPGLGISILIVWIGLMQILARPIEKYVPWLENILPWRLISSFGEPPMAGYLALGAPLPTVVPIIATAVWCVLFVVVAIVLLFPACARQPQPARIEEITFQSEEFKLVGVLRTPAGTRPFPVVLFVHGSGNADRTMFGAYLPIMQRMLGAGLRGLFLE